MIRRLAVGIVATFVAFSCLTIVTESEALAANRSILDWNSAGNKPGFGENNPNWLTTYLGPSVLSREPTLAVITLQEVCYQQAYYFWFNYLQYRPGPWGYFGWYSALHEEEECLGHQYGNAVFMIGGGATTTLQFTNPSQAGLYEKRGMVCMNGQHGWGTLQVGVCSLHLQVDNVRTADCQVGEAFLYANSWVASGDRIVMAGDFNIRLYSQTVPGVMAYRCPGQPLNTTELGKVYAGPYTEADEFSGSGNQATVDSGGHKIDYVFASTNTYLWYDLLINDSVSDHKLLTAHVSM